MRRLIKALAGAVLLLKDIRVRPVERAEAARYQQLPQAHHYWGALPKISATRFKR